MEKEEKQAAANSVPKAGAPADEYRTGIFRANEKGFGFIETDVEDEDDFFVPEKYTLHAFHGDTVKFRVLPDQRGERSEARITEIVEHAVKQVVGTYEKSEGYGFIVCDSKKIIYDIYVRRENSMHARDGEKVVADIVSYGSERMSPEGKIVEILGDKDAPGVDILSLVKSYEVPDVFPEEVMDQAGALPEEIPEAELARRTDLRDVPTCTIDGDDSKDFDDAVSIQRDGTDYVLAVHIADVTNYVTEGKSPGPGSPEAWNICLPLRPGHPHAAEPPFGRPLLYRRRKGPAGPVLHHAFRPYGSGERVPDLRVRHPIQPPHDL